MHQFSPHGDVTRMRCVEGVKKGLELHHVSAVHSLAVLRSCIVRIIGAVTQAFMAI
jgi:hypothetical protein